MLHLPAQHEQYCMNLPVLCQLMKGNASREVQHWLQGKTGKTFWTEIMIARKLLSFWTF